MRLMKMTIIEQDSRGWNGRKHQLLAWMYIDYLNPGRWHYHVIKNTNVWKWFRGEETEFRTGRSIAIYNCLRFGKWNSR